MKYISILLIISYLLIGTAWGEEINRLEQKGVVIERTKELFGDIEKFLTSQTNIGND